jgi:hypothetical protein
LIRNRSSRIQKTKRGGTADIAEHRASAFVVGTGNEETREEIFDD